MKIPSNMTEKEVIEVIDRISSGLAYMFRFGYHDYEDIKQISWQFAIVGLEDYDEVRPLHSFLYTHIRNRLINYKRDNFMRNDPPCNLCHGYLVGGTLHDNEQYCKKYLKWYKLNYSKKNIMSPVSIEKISPGGFAIEYLGVLENSEMRQKIDDNINPQLRKAYIKYLNGVKISRNLKQKLIQELKKILCPAQDEEE